MLPPNDHRVVNHQERVKVPNKASKSKYQFD